jgi:cyclic beta-1,2-glucan synthetase
MKRKPARAALPLRLAAYDALLRRTAADWIARLPEGPVPAAVTRLLDNLSFLQTRLHELREALSPAYCRKLMRCARPASEPRPYTLLAAAFAQPGTTPDEASLCLCLDPEHGPALTLAELWAAPGLLQLVLLERIFALLDGGPLAEPSAEAALTGAIDDLRACESLPWRGIIERVSVVDRVLRRDPAGVYARMEFESRDLYRQTVEQIAESSPYGEEHVARTAVALAGENPFGSRESHVGYYLLDGGVARLRRRAGCRFSLPFSLRRLAQAFPCSSFVASVALFTALALAAMHRACPGLPLWWLVLALLPASQLGVQLTHLGAGLAFPPRRLPRLDFTDGIPEEHATFVAVPTLLLSRQGVENLLERIEIHFLANRDRHLYFALLTDFADSDSPTNVPAALLEACAEGIHRLNARHAPSIGRAPFYLFHRNSQFNAQEGVWMGRERKRGKLEDFNAFLLGRGDAFDFKTGDLRALPPIRYVLTLDSDTQLPPASARKLVGTLAHPLNRPVLDPRTGIVRHGHALLQPRVGVSMESAGRSLIALLSSGQTGLDPYTKAVSDTYHDFFGRASYTGKGLYDVRAFVEVLDGRFPSNSLLSHDLIEGEHLRAALAGDVELIDDYPATYEADCKRKHRWVRGDWQILFWLLPRVPLAGWRWARNPLPATSRWKIFDNLRRSLVDPAFALALSTAWFFGARASAEAVAAGVGLALAPAWAEFLTGFLRLPPRRFWRSFFLAKAEQLGRAHAEALLGFALLLHRGFLLADAILRALTRRFLTQRLLLEWQSMAAVESESGTARSLPKAYLYASSGLAFLGMLAGVSLRGGNAAAFVAALWVLAPVFTALLDEPPPRLLPGFRDHTAFLRDTALLTWRFFDELSTPAGHWLVPDNIQEDPPATAHRTSPTNFGLQLASHVAAYEFGYLTAAELSERCGRLLQTIETLPRERGHFYNWYDTTTLAPLPPLFLSTVDSGNLAAALLTVKQTFLELPHQPLIRPAILDGLRDHCLRLRNALPGPSRGAALMRQIEAFLRQLDYRPAGLFAWEGLLTDLSALASGIGRHVAWLETNDPAVTPTAAASLSYWRRALRLRTDTALSQLRSLAPWLDEPLEEPLRSCAYLPAFSRLTALLERNANFDQLPDQYAAIDAEIESLLHSPAPPAGAIANALSRLRPQLALARARARTLTRTAAHHAQLCHALAYEMDFAFLFEEPRQLLRIGYDAGAQQLAPSCYDLLASEARIAVFSAIAKGDIPIEAWFKLGRKLILAEGVRTLVSWSGTMFEYLMPLLFTSDYPGTLLGEACKAAVKAQRRYAARRGTPWGISESAHLGRDSRRNYQYKAFGVPGLGMQTPSSANVVIAPYASVLALMIDPTAAAANLRTLASRGWRGPYGFYEAIQFEPHRFERRPTLIRSFMAHHQGMSLLALANVLLNNPVRERFQAEPSVRAATLLLQERLPSLVGAVAPEPPLAVPEPAPLGGTQHAGAAPV